MSKRILTLLTLSSFLSCNNVNAASTGSPWVEADETNGYPLHVLTAVTSNADITTESSKEFFKSIFRSNHKASIVRAEGDKVVGYGKILKAGAGRPEPYAVKALKINDTTEALGLYTEAKVPKGSGSTEEGVIPSKKTKDEMDAIETISRYFANNLPRVGTIDALTAICGEDNARLLVKNFGDATLGFDALLKFATPIVKAALVGGSMIDVDAAKARAKSSAEFTEGFKSRECRIGEDQRIKVKDTTLYPWHAQGKLYMTYNTIFGTKGFIGSGTLVGPRHVLTAGHCAYDGTLGWPSAIEFIPGKSGDDAPFGKYNVAKILAPKQWVSSEEDSWDMALLILERNVEEKLGFMGLIALPKDELLNYTVNIAGFPGDRDSGEIMYTMGEALTDIEEEELGYTIDTAGGQSGSGVWSKWRRGAAAGGAGAASGGTSVAASEFLPGYHCAGIHVRGSNKGNEATRITHEKLKLLVNWINEH